MRRITIVGPGGAGKTVLANRLGALLDLPVTHLDALRYDLDWNVVPESQFIFAQQTVVTGDEWIVDGNSLTSMPIRFAAADTVIVLDLPALTCLWSILRRRLAYRGGQHPDGVYDRITWPFLRYVLLYRRRTGPAVRGCIAAYGSHATLIELTSRRQVHRLLAGLGDRPARTDRRTDGA